jgi:indole-3-glycerol phosphate synthase
VSDFLQRMAAGSFSRCKSARELRGEEQLRRSLPELASPRQLVLSGTFDVIAEVKLSSPSEGALVEVQDERTLVVGQGRTYAGAGAAAISVLTEPKRFAGSLNHLAQVSGSVHVPVMRKDFLVDPYQVLEARLTGADGVLLIVRLLEDGALRSMLDLARELGLFVLLEAFDEDDLRRAGELLTEADAKAPQVLLGLNARDLSTLEVDPDRLERLAGSFPAGFLRVAESGLQTPDDAERFARLGYSLALVGSALMRAKRPGPLLNAMVRAGREACSG